MNEKILYYSKTITESLSLKIECGEMETAQIIRKNIVVIYAKISENYIKFDYVFLFAYEL